MERIRVRDAVTEKWFHISTKGMDRLPFTTPQDFKQAINIIAVGSYMYGIGIYAYCLMSNHIHLAIKSESELVATMFVNYFKWRYSQYFRKARTTDPQTKYDRKKGSGIFDKVPILIKELKTEQSKRNCIAYILRNPIEARICSNADQYLWSSYNCYFKDHIDNQASSRPVHSIPKRRLRKLLNTHLDMSDCNYQISSDGWILPDSIIDTDTVKKLFSNSRDELSKYIAVNPYLTLEYELSNPAKLALPHYELIQVASEIANKKFDRNLSALTMSERSQMVITLHSDYHATPYVISQVLSLNRKHIHQILNIPLIR